MVTSFNGLALMISSNELILSFHKKDLIYIQQNLWVGKSERSLSKRLKFNLTA